MVDIVDLSVGQGVVIGALLLEEDEDFEVLVGHAACPDIKKTLEQFNQFCANDTHYQLLSAIKINLFTKIRTLGYVK